MLSYLTLLRPTSMRRAPGLTMDASTRPGTPAADTIISADLNRKIS